MFGEQVRATAKTFMDRQVTVAQFAQLIELRCVKFLLL